MSKSKKNKKPLYRDSNGRFTSNKMESAEYDLPKEIRKTVGKKNPEIMKKVEEAFYTIPIKGKIPPIFIDGNAPVKPTLHVDEETIMTENGQNVVPSAAEAAKLGKILGDDVVVVWDGTEKLVGDANNSIPLFPVGDAKFTTKYSFVEPHPTGGHSIVTITAADAIAWQREVGKQKNHEYESDEKALEDFLITHWAIPADSKEESFVDKKVDVVLVNNRNNEEKVLTDVAIKDIPIFNIVDSPRGNQNLAKEWQDILAKRAEKIAEEERNDKSWVEKIKRGWLEFVSLFTNGPKNVWTGEYADSKLERVLAKVDGRMCALLYADKNANSDDVEDVARKDDRVLKRIGNRKIVKVIVVTNPTKYINFVTEEVKDDQSK